MFNSPIWFRFFKVLRDLTILLLMKALFYWAFTWFPVVDWLNWLLSLMQGIPLSFRGDGSGASSSKQPQLDLNNVPTADAEPELAPPSDQRALEDENRRLREENEALKKLVEEELDRVKAVLTEAEQKMERAQELDRIRDQERAVAGQNLNEEYYRKKKKYIHENDRLKFRINEKQYEEDRQRFRRN